MSTYDRAEPAIATYQANSISKISVRPFWVAIVVGVAALIAYVATLAPDIVGGDGGEFQFVPYVLGIPHRTGYPLYTVVGKLWSFIPLGSVAFRMNLLSAVFGAATVAFVYLAAWEMTSRLVPSLLAAASLAVSGLFWLWSTMAGVRSSTAMTTAVVIYLALRYQRLTKTAPGSPVASNAFIWLAFAYGIALAHHRSVIPP
ncbi:MAG: DUF2723 domain-containing protein [Chloroflexi bacterium]|nr:DUF2723 domain-containing protein [Chloroflexota bacterium]